MKTLYILLVALEVVARLVGVGAVEDLDEETVLHFEQLEAHPLRINTASHRRLAYSRLFSEYQIASLEEYISSSGQILSFTELSLIDGFSKDFVDDIRPFVSLSHSGAPGQVRERRLSADAMTRYSSGSKTDPKLDVHAKGEWGEAVGVNWSTKGAFAMSYNRGNYSVGLGDFNLKSGQGLVCWTGMTMSGISGSKLAKGGAVGVPTMSTSLSGEALRRAQALRQAQGPEEALRQAQGPVKQAQGPEHGVRMCGVYAGYSSYRADVGVFCGGAVSGIGANANYRWRSGQVGAIVMVGDEWLCGVNGKVNVRGVDVFAEVAYDVRNTDPAAIAGIAWSPQYGSLISAAGRFYGASYDAPHAAALRTSTHTRDEYGLALAFQHKSLSGTLDLSNRISSPRPHAKLVTQFSKEYTISELTLKPTLRYASRLRPLETLRFKQDFKAELKTSFRALMATIRFNLTRYETQSFALSSEAGWNNGKHALYLSGAVFVADKWNDRIYVWQRGVPGTFNVPALYGRGWCYGLYARICKDFYLHFASTTIPSQPDRNVRQLKLQYQRSF